MKKLSIRLITISYLALMTFGVYAKSQTASDYDTLVQKGKTQLQAGSADLALASSEAAIKLDANRWEAYGLAGGALMNIKRYEEAEDSLSRALDRAPEVTRAFRHKGSSNSELG
jgi:Flp pilus assembly protein TadD